MQPPLTVEQILHPRSVGVIGASEDVGKFGGRIMQYLIRHRFSGRIVPVNQTRTEIRGIKAYPRIGDAPGAVDVCILAVPAAVLVQACRECAEAGVGACVIMTTGFAEIGPLGQARQDELTTIAHSNGMRIIGPNCMGLINPHHALALTSSLVLETGELMRGRVGLISQSGALMVSMYDRAHSAGIGFSACISLGNQCDLEICDVLEFMRDDPRTEAICLYAEGLKTPRRFLDLALDCRRRGKPVLMVKAGRTEAGVRAALSHTASLAGSYAVLVAACEEHGVLLLDDPDDMIRAADTLLRSGVPRADGIAVLSPSGGGAAVMIDRICDRGMRPAVFNATTQVKLAEHLLPTFVGNPIDLGGRRDPNAPGLGGELVRVLAADPDVGVICVLLTTAPDFTSVARGIGEALLAAGKPFVLTVTPGTSADAPRTALRELGCSYDDHADSALRVMQALVESHRLAMLPMPRGIARPPTLPRADAMPTLPVGRLTEPEAKRLAAAYGVSVSTERQCANVEEAVRAASALGYPVVLKPVCRALVHKSDIGAVRLGIADDDALRAAWAEVMDAVRRAVPDADIEGGLVQRMHPGEIELIIGARRDPQFGPVLLVGAGGTLAELHNDVAIALAPVEPAEARRRLQRLRIWPLLTGWRGRPAPDLDAAIDAACRLSWLANDLGERLIEIELNPLLVGVHGAVAVDARAMLA